MKLVIERPAVKALSRMQPKTASAIIAALERIAVNPFDPHPNVKRLAGSKGGFRFRHGDWRALYRLDRATNTMVVENVKPRGGAYR